MKINISVRSESIGFQIFDSLHAYRQSLNSKHSGDWDIVTNQPVSPTDCSVLFVSLPENLDIEELGKYDLVFMCNGGEPLTVATQCMTELIKLPNVYLIANSLLTKAHPLADKVVWWPDPVMQCRDYWCRHFYPHYFENLRNTGQEKKWWITAINGQNRSHRHWLFSELLSQVSEINQINRISTDIKKLNDPHWASKEDLTFHKWINSRYTETIPEPDSYQSSPPSMGINGKFGTSNMGYFIIPEYWQSHCMIWPETTWQNNELCLTEKACKCFYTMTLPWPVGGANLNALYQEQGFYTAWHLLPPEHKKFDSILDHTERYQAMVGAMQWLADNKEIMTSHFAKELLHNNQKRFLLCASDVNAVMTLNNLFEKYAK